MKNIRVLAACAVAFALAVGACSVSDGVKSVVQGVTDITSALSSPEAVQAAQNLNALGRAVVCAASEGASLGADLEAAVSAKQAVITETGKVVVASAELCRRLNGRAVTVVTR